MPDQSSTRRLIVKRLDGTNQKIQTSHRLPVVLYRRLFREAAQRTRSTGETVTMTDIVEKALLAELR